MLWSRRTIFLALVVSAPVVLGMCVTPWAVAVGHDGACPSTIMRQSPSGTTERAPPPSCVSGGRRSVGADYFTKYENTACRLSSGEVTSSIWPNSPEAASSVSFV